MPETGCWTSAWAVLFILLRSDSRHGSELISRYLDAAWADCVVSVEPGLRFFLRASLIVTHHSRTFLESVSAKGRVHRLRMMSQTALDNVKTKELHEARAAAQTLVLWSGGS